MGKLRWVFTYLSLWRTIPAYLFFKKNRFHEKCAKDLDAWTRYAPELKVQSSFWRFAYILVNYKEFRNIFLNRLHRNPMMYVITRICFLPLESCYINMPPENIGGGFSLQHGFSSIITAKEIGEDCRIYQQVTVGFRGEHAPVIGDRVTIAAGAIVIGDVNIGDDSYVGAGAVVISDVPPKAIVVGVPAKTIKFR